MFTYWSSCTAEGSNILMNILCNMDCIPIWYVIMDRTVPILSHRYWLCSVIVRIYFLTYFLIYLVWIMTMIGSFLYSVDSAIGLDVSIMVTGYFIYLTRTIMSSGFWNSWSTYCFSFYLNFLYCSLVSLCSSMVPNTNPKSSTYPLKFWMDDVYAGRLKCLTHPKFPWWPPLPSKPSWPSTWPLFLEIYLLMVLRHQMFVASLSPSLLPVDGGAVYISGVMYFSF